MSQHEHPRVKYTSRPVSPEFAEKLAGHLQRRVELERAGRAGVEDWRNWLTVDPEACSHTTCTMTEIETAFGAWGVEICNFCGTQTARQCPHYHNTWHLDGQVLICDLCGADGT